VARQASTERRPAVGRWLKRRAENVIVALLTLMFVAFLLQIGFRYLLNQPLGWTDEVTVLCWVWVVLWGAAFILQDHEEIRFDVVSSKVSPPVRRVFVFVTSVVLVVLFAWSFKATVGYVLFMKREKSAYLGMRFDYLYFIYVIFAVAIMVRHVRLAWRALRGAVDEASPLDGVGEPR